MSVIKVYPPRRKKRGCPEHMLGHVWKEAHTTSYNTSWKCIYCGASTYTDVWKDWSGSARSRRLERKLKRRTKGHTK